MAGAGRVVAIVAGAEQAAKVNDASASSDDSDGDNDFMTEVTGEGRASYKNNEVRANRRPRWRALPFLYRAL